MATRNFLIAAVACVGALLRPVRAQASDWKYAGAMDEKTIIFFDAESVANDEPVVRYWVKIITEEELERVANSMSEKDKAAFIDRATTMIAGGYMPPLLRISSFRKSMTSRGVDFRQFHAQVVCWEMLAAMPAKMAARILFEVDCGRRASRFIEGVAFDENEKVKGMQKGVEWRFIAPDTNGAWMADLLCAR